MPSRIAEQQPSQTALFTALRRALAHQEYRDNSFGPDRLARCFLPSNMQFVLRFRRLRTYSKAKLAAAFPGMQEYVIARTAFFDRVFLHALESRTSQIVLLGAGYDSRAYRFAGQNHDSQIFELDAPATQDRKRKCLKAARVAIPPWVNFVPIDFSRESLAATLERAGYQVGDRTLFLWEGVSYYLDATSVDATLAFVRQSAEGSTIAFDYTITLTPENTDSYYGVREFAQTMASHHADEQLLFSVRDGHIGSFLESRGLRLLEHLSAEEIESEYLVDGSGSLLGPIVGHFRFALASPMVR